MRSPLPKQAASHADRPWHGKEERKGNKRRWREEVNTETNPSQGWLGGRHGPFTAAETHILCGTL